MSGLKPAVVGLIGSAVNFDEFQPFSYHMGLILLFLLIFLFYTTLIIFLISVVLAFKKIKSNF